MAVSRPVHLLRDLDLLNWPTLFVGWKHHLIRRADLIDFAVGWLMKHPDDEDPRVIEMASAENLDAAELTALLRSYVEAVSGRSGEDDYSQELDRWRFAEIWLLANSGLDAEEKLERLQQLYADYDYPEDMARCSRYYLDPSQEQQGWAVGDLDQSPLEAMVTLSIDLSTKLGVKDKLSLSILRSSNRHA